jgi:hypothetical protein
MMFELFGVIPHLWPHEQANSIREVTSKVARRGGIRDDNSPKTWWTQCLFPPDKPFFSSSWRRLRKAFSRLQLSFPVTMPLRACQEPTLANKLEEENALQSRVELWKATTSDPV